MATVKEQRDLLEWSLERLKERNKRFLEWHKEADAKAYDMAEAYHVSSQAVKEAEKELRKFIKAHKLL